MLTPWMLNLVSSTMRPWGIVYGVGEFKDPVTFQEYVLLAADGNVYLCLQNNAPRLLALPAGVTITARCTFLQAFNVVILLRGFDASPLVMDSVDVGFKEIVQSVAGDGTLTIPNCLRGVFAANRIWLLREDDTLVASDVTDYTRYTLLNDFKVNQGDADNGVAISAFGHNTILVFKQRSVYRLDEIFSDDLEAITLSLVTNRYGCIAADTVVDCGSDMLWLSQDGVASLTLTIQNEIQAAQGALSGKNRMFSEDIGPLIDRIHGTYIENSFGVLWQDRYYLGVPLDMAEVLGVDLALGQETLPSGELTIRDLVIGQTYRWIPAINSGGMTTTLVSGSTTATSATTFVATATEATITTSITDSFFIQDSFKRVFPGVNNALLHYDFQNAAWGGYDEGVFLSFKFIFTASHVNRRRLFIVDSAGYVRLWEEDYTDRLAEPYVDIEVSALPSAGSTVRVNLGNTITADPILTLNTGLNWGCFSLGHARVNIWGLNQVSGYSPDTVTPWTAPNTRRVRPIEFVEQTGIFIPVAGTIRFYSTVGVPVAVVVTGSAWHNITHYVEQQIQSLFETRAYNPSDVNDIKPMRCTLDIRTWNPNYSASLLFDGVNEEVQIVSDSERSRVQYLRPFNKADWDPTNTDDDFNTPYRGDYSIQQTGTDWEMYLWNGVRTNLHQSARHTVRCRGRDRSCRVLITGEQGRFNLLAARLEATVQAPRNGVKV
jgi:hypothetical protein